MLDITAFQHRILMYYCHQYCYRCRSGGILDKRFADFDCPGVQNRLERVIRYSSVHFSCENGHRGLSRVAILASNIARLYRNGDTSKGAKSDFEKCLAFHVEATAERRSGYFSDGPEN